MMTPEITDFQQLVLSYYAAHGRHDMLWRQPPFDPYKIMVSEVMLQQTQVARVTEKFPAFLRFFPDVQALATAPLADVLAAWSGLGYNRRAKFLWQAAQIIMSNFDGIFPTTGDELTTLPGVGRNTAGAIAAYAFNQPVVFIETNIRTVIIHHFFEDKQDISDADIMQIIGAALDKKAPRQWYYALMDYGAFLKQTVGNLNKQSKSYSKQSRFAGSLRQLRGQVLRLLRGNALTIKQLSRQVTDERLPQALIDLEKEALISYDGQRYRLG
jgi:A/G-specific adenine glycosylase